MHESRERRSFAASKTSINDTFPRTEFSSKKGKKHTPQQGQWGWLFPNILAQKNPTEYGQ